MDLGAEIAGQIAKLPPEMQREVLRFATSLNESVPRGKRGADLKHFAASLDSQSAHEMLRAIQEECERVDTPEW
jgi:hypothetical protein